MPEPTLTGYPDIDWWATHDGGDPLDDEPAADAMHWAPGPAANPPGWPSPRPRQCRCGNPPCQPKETK